MPEVIIVTQRESGKGGRVFQSSEERTYIVSAPEEEAVAEAVTRHGARAVIVGLYPYTGALYRALQATAGDCGAVIARFGVGHENVNKALAREHGILVCNTPGALDQSVAELTMWLIGSFSRHLSTVAARFQAGEFAGVTGTELYGKRLGVVGLGRIGQRVAAAAHFGFGMKVIASGASSAAQLEARHGCDLAAIEARLGLEHYTDDSDAVFRESDFVTLHFPSNAATRRFVDARRLGLMKPTAVLINTARGAVVDEAALFDALAAKAIGGAALDVFEKEPYQPISPGQDLRTLPNVLLTPHIGSDTREANDRMARAAADNVANFFAGKLDQMSVVRVG